MRKDWGRSRLWVAAMAVACVGVSTLGLSAPASGSSRRPYDTALTLPGGAPTVRSVAHALEVIGDALPDNVEMRLEQVRRSPLGQHLRGRQISAGRPIDGTWFVAWIAHGKLRAVDVRYSQLSGRSVRDGLPRTGAVAAAVASAGAERHLVEPRVERLFVPVGTKLVDAWRVEILTNAGAARIDVDAGSGAVLRRVDAAVYDTSATVFDPNPVVALRDSSVRQSGVDLFGVDTDLDEARLNGALVRLPIRGANVGAYESGRLVGPYVDVQGPAPLVPTNAGFSYTRGDPRFETTMSYAHLDRLQRYLQTTLGLKQVNAEPQNVYAVPVQGLDNSFYMSGQDLIVLGAGGVDDGEDAEVIVHEYGHAIHDDQVPGWGQSHESGSMGEGFGDFLAAAYLARTSNGFQDECVADWDATSYSDEDPPCLRRLDTGKRYPDSMEGEVHADGEIWSAFLWTLRAKLGDAQTQQSDNALRLVVTSHELLPPDADFKSGVTALRTAARGLGHPEWVPYIDQAAAAHGLR